MTEEEKDLSRIELTKTSWESEFIRKMEIWKAIVMQVNSNTGKKQLHWSRVMELYHKKYK